ncbi:sugar phosphate isomerase/epimerase family protein [Sphingomonas sp. KC8]|uniref:sugar phosphate isomerase/epimerase family protein n=1 Tax=Sphingomonas sp. KC8 TaxID=1030157 RepID=UPI0002F798AA|nr:sugar phosphate isomerase/epimerase family protein [Sphingomonas sp. KC8]
MESENKNRLIACHWTIAGDHHPLRSKTGTSPHPLPARMAAAARAGFTGMGFLQSDIPHLLAQHDVREIARMLADHGLTDIEVECLGDWFADGERRRTSDKMRHMLLDFGTAIGARHLKVMGPYGESWPVDHLRESFAGVCADAAGSGMGIGIEMLPFSEIATPERTLEIVGDAPDGGIYLDIWHVRHGHISDDQLRAIPLDRITGIEINDAIPDPDMSMFDATIEHRLLPGEGTLDPAGFVRTMRDIGYSGPIGVEIISNAQRARSLDDAVDAAFAATTTCLATLG